MREQSQHARNCTPSPWTGQDSSVDDDDADQKGSSSETVLNAGCGRPVRVLGQWLLYTRTLAARPALAKAKEIEIEIKEKKAVMAATSSSS